MHLVHLLMAALIGCGNESGDIGEGRENRGPLPTIEHGRNDRDGDVARQPLAPARQRADGESVLGANADRPGPPAEVGAPAAGNGELVAVLSGTSLMPEVGGEVRFVPTGGGVEARVTVEGLAPGGWVQRVHSGSCANPGPVLASGDELGTTAPARLIGKAVVIHSEPGEEPLACGVIGQAAAPRAAP